ncbi:RNA polymerase sigma factor [Salinicoccus siamensis]|uniref:RNA polymerase sigma factor n=1 Tax=Salinicoccus siamensis TaxID=381830 RepID=A0ABV5Z525_9STAP
MYHITAYQFYIRERGTADDMDQLACRVDAGDAAAFDIMDERIRPYVRRLTYRYTEHFQDREDMEQEMMEVALKLCSRYDHTRGRYMHYLYRTLRFEMMSRSSARGLRRCRERASIEKMYDESKSGEREADPINMMVKEEQLQYLLHKKGICSPLEQKVLQHLDMGHSIEDVCLAFELDRKAVLNTLHRIRRKKELLSHEGWEGGPFDNTA